jgi:hypothetical protein
MEIKRYAVINKETREVTNVIAWDGVSLWTPPAGHYVVQHDHVDIGDTHLHLEKTTTFFKPDRTAKDI